MPDLQPLLDRVKRLSADLPEVVVGSSYGFPALRVKGKSIVTVKAPDTLVLFAPPEAKDMLMAMAPDIYFQTDHYRGWPSLLVRADCISDTELAARLREAWRMRAPKRLAAGLPA